jgi:hypothetical protein
MKWISTFQYRVRYNGAVAFGLMTTENFTFNGSKRKYTWDVYIEKEHRE